jgi:hypothetical protein
MAAAGEGGTTGGGKSAFYLQKHFVCLNVLLCHAQSSSLLPGWAAYYCYIRGCIAVDADLSPFPCTMCVLIV